MENLGFLNNNPFNIRSGSNWKGLDNPSSYKGFCRFTYTVYGVRAFLYLMRRYSRQYGLVTIRDVISRYAPSSENDTETYISNVCKYVGVPSSYPVNVWTSTVPDSSKFFSFACAVAKQECGYYLTEQEFLNALILL